MWAPGDAGDGRIPLGGLTLVVGRGGIGKSTLLAEFTAWTTRGERKGEFYGKPRDVMYVADEDSLEDTATPRRLAAGLNRVHFIGISMRPAPERRGLWDGEALGQSCGRLTRRIHLACDGRGRPFALPLTGGTSAAAPGSKRSQTRSGSPGRGR
ncbi:AAA family ATPase [Streptomyces filamentosus]|uniref:AAA family ATPase n=1 Tax=Streptomyces filamentosus TaxID=67294 RepID=UPI0037CD782E